MCCGVWFSFIPPIRVCGVDPAGSGRSRSRESSYGTLCLKESRLGDDYVVGDALVDQRVCGERHQLQALPDIA